ncbi:MAG: pilus assembly protein [Myxococcaceae bacterium]|nr:pilus assembly protein [Myxococcaceae bacterium]
MGFGSRTNRGQAAVEAALTLPLTVFMVLGTLQLFLMLQARLLAEHAAFNAARTGSLSQGSCVRMKHAAILTLLPAFARADSPERVAAAFDLRKGNAFVAADRAQGDIVWLDTQLQGNPDRSKPEDLSFDDPDRAQVLRLVVRLTFWCPLRIPFANWVIARSVLAAWGLQPYVGVNPLEPATKASWTVDVNGAPAAAGADVRSTFKARAGNPAGTYVFPIHAAAERRMMTAPRFSATHLGKADGRCQ